VFKIMPSPLPLSQAWERGALQGGVREKDYGCYRHKTCMNEARGNFIKVNSLVPLRGSKK
ncbi:hypothetical protein, partial [Calothrix sp. CCY 0018]|uniref:hypothetical protein n=1 Tax=Calothrix sp. CCY 0018 TaxID=3103864 RepID=UPI0039C71DDE